MKVKVVTHSGTIYIFQESEGKIKFTKNFIQEGIVEGKLEINLGMPLRFNYYALNVYDYHKEKDLSLNISTSVEKVELL